MEILFQIVQSNDEAISNSKHAPVPPRLYRLAKIKERDVMTTEVFPAKTPFTIRWRDGFKIGVDQVDQEHQRLFELITALNLESVTKTVDDLLDYVVIHFSNEQELMESSGYPDFKDHLKLHEEFAAQVADFLGSGEDWSEERVQELRRFLNKWLIGHIMTHDLRFGKWLAHHKTASTPAVPAEAPVAGFLSRLFGRR
jgi:hemerythrin